MKPLDRRRFEALAGYVRFPYSFLFAEELAWFEEGDEKLLGLVSLDVSDGDYILTVLARDAVNRYRAVDVQSRVGIEPILPLGPARGWSTSRVRSKGWS